MYNIDLLRGTKIPPQSRPIRVALATMTLAIPLAVGLMVFGWYSDVKAQIPAQERLLAGHEERIRELADVKEFLETTKKRKQRLSAYVQELAVAVPSLSPWSDRILALAQCVPPDLTVCRLQLRRKEIVQKAAARAQAKEKSRTPAPEKDRKSHQYTLEVGVYVPADGRHNTSILDFKNLLARSPVFGCDLQNITTIISQPETLFERPYTFHLLECVFN